MVGSRQSGPNRFLTMVHRGFELCVAVMLSVAGFIPLGVFLMLTRELILGSPDFPIWKSVLGFLVAGVFAWWCAQTTWRLFTRHEREGGGLLSPLVLVLVGTTLVGFAVTIAMVYGSPR